MTRRTRTGLFIWSAFIWGVLMNISGWVHDRRAQEVLAGVAAFFLACFAINFWKFSRQLPQGWLASEERDDEGR